MMKILCLLCLHYHEDGTCRAFPEGVPDEIRFGDKDHDKPVKGDHGVQFKSLDPELEQGRHAPAAGRKC